MKILGIETSCDDTCASVVEKNKGKINLLSQIISSQEKLHAPYGGVFPSLAKREHQTNIVPVLEEALNKAGLLKLSKPYLIDVKKTQKLEKLLARNPELFVYLNSFLGKYAPPKIDKLAITIGPGLEPCLWVGVNLAKALAFYWNLPVIGVNHLEGHILSSEFSNVKKLSFPAIGLIVSGGNTQLILIKEIGKYQLIGETRDDAAGECFDKTARILGLNYPGGKEISQQASKFKTSKFDLKLPRPMMYDKNFDFSFSGLKTAVLYDFNKRSPNDRQSSEYIIEMSKEIQNSIIDVLIYKTTKAAEKYKARSIVLGGGVAANTKLRQAITDLSKTKGLACALPSNDYTADNASMIALTALISPNPKLYSWQRIKPKSNFKIYGNK